MAGENRPVAKISLDPAKKQVGLMQVYINFLEHAHQNYFYILVVDLQTVLRFLEFPFFPWISFCVGCHVV
jgi:hypothetical protein